MVLDLLAAAILTLFAVVGAVRGGLASGLSLFALVGGYIAGLVCAHLFGGVAGAAFGLPLLGPAIAGSIGFAAVFLVCGIFGFFLRRWDAENRGDLPRGGFDRIMGACFGLARGGLVVVLLGFLGIWLQAARELSPETAVGPDVSGSTTAAFAGLLIEGAVDNVMGDASPGARFAARVAARPGETLKSMQSLLEHPHIQSLQDDPLFWTLIENGASERALNQGSFYRIAHDDSMRADLAKLGLISPEAAADPAMFRAETELMLDELGPRIRGLRNDPEIHRLARDPEVMGMLESGNTLALLRHPGIQTLARKWSQGI